MPTTAAADAPHSHSLAPSPWMQRHAGLLQAGQSLLDVACGHGRHARYFAARGLRVTAVDRDGEALAQLRALTPPDHPIDIQQHDLEADPWPYPPAAFDALLVCNYLWRPRLPQLLATLAPGGLLLYETFMDGHQQYGRPRNPEFLLQPNELLHRLLPGHRILAYHEGPLHDPHDPRDPDRPVTAVKQHIVARRHPDSY